MGRPRLWSIAQLAALALVCTWAPWATAQPTEATQALPLWLAGTVVAPPTSTALVVVLDTRAQPVGSVLLKEGETIQGYRLVTVEGDRASFERDGQLFSIRLGQPLPLAPSEAKRDEAGMPPGPEVEAPRRGPAPNPRGVATGPASDGVAPKTSTRTAVDEEEVRQWSRTVLEGLRENPTFQESVEKLRQSRQRPPQVKPAR